MGTGTGEVPLALFINDTATPVAAGRFPVNHAGNSSKTAIGQEQDATTIREVYRSTGRFSGF